MGHLVWVATTVVRVGEFHIGLRSSSVAVRDAIEAAMEPHVVVDHQVRASHAIHASEATEPGSRPVYRVYHDCKNVFTTPSLGRAVAALAVNLEQYLPRNELAPPLLELDVSALLMPGQALLAPWSLPYHVPDVESRLRGFGLRLLESRSVLVNAETAEVVVPTRRLLSANTDRAGVWGDVTPQGRIPLTGWFFLHGAGRPHPLTRAAATANAMSMIYRRSTSAAEDLRSLSQLVRGVEVQGVVSDKELLVALRKRLSAGRLPREVG